MNMMQWCIAESKGPVQSSFKTVLWSINSSVWPQGAEDFEMDFVNVNSVCFKRLFNYLLFLIYCYTLKIDN